MPVLYAPSILLSQNLLFKNTSICYVFFWTLDFGHMHVMCVNEIFVDYLFEPSSAKWNQLE